MLKNREALRWVAKAVNVSYWIPELTFIHVQNGLAIGTDRRRTHVARIQNLPDGFYDAKELVLAEYLGHYKDILPIENKTYHPLLPSQNPFKLFPNVAINCQHLREAIAGQSTYQLTTDGLNIKGYLDFGWFYIFGKQVKTYAL